MRIGYTYQWTGFGQSKVSEDIQPAKTLWDWLDLLIVPAMLALGGYLFTRWDRRAAVQQAQDATLQAYVDRMAQLLTDE
jgi:hypothetical protein